MLKKVLLFLLPLLCSCGFKLHGYNPELTALSPLKIQVIDYNPTLIAALNNILKQNHIKYYYGNSRSTKTLVIHKLSRQEQLTAVSSSTTPRQYLIILTLQYSLLNSKGHAIIDNQSIQASRQVTINNDRILGSEMEKNTIQTEMLPELFNRMLQKLVRT